MEYSYGGKTLPYLPVFCDYKEGKLYPNDRPGLGVELDMSKLTQIMEVTKYDTNRAQLYYRPDGSITNW
jgi:L-alanine-DL-glutamate epimerase-like enolase superfamily enzyme